MNILWNIVFLEAKKIASSLFLEENQTFGYPTLIKNPKHLIYKGAMLRSNYD